MWELRTELSAAMSAAALLTVPKSVSAMTLLMACVFRSSIAPTQGAGSIAVQPALSAWRPCSHWSINPFSVLMAASMVAWSSSWPKSCDRDGQRRR